MGEEEVFMNLQISDLELLANDISLRQAKLPECFVVERLSRDLFPDDVGEVAARNMPVVPLSSMLPGKKTWYNA
jgi:hypothetical protein